MKLQLKKMASLLTLALLLVLCGCAGSKKKIADSSEFRQPTYCAKCHRDLYNQWKGSPHNNSQKDPIYQKLYLLADKESDGQAENVCAASVCHTPIGHLAAEIPPIDGSKLSDIAKLGVQCDFCHTVSDFEKVGNGSYVVSPGKVKRGPFKNAKSPAHKTEYSKLHTEAVFCGLCHNVNHPQNNLPLEATFTEWEEGPYNTGDADTSTTCQDCHMTPGPGETFPNPGRAASIGPERDHIFTHDFAGANVALAKIMNSPHHGELAEERLKAAATVEVVAPGTAEKGKPMPIEVRVKNVGAGHMIPTGVTELRQMWLEVLASDAEGSYFFGSGTLDNEGNVDPGGVMYNTVMGDIKGRRTTHIWKAEKILSDNRIAPGQMKTEAYNINLPQDVIGPIGIEVRLRYRSAPQDLIDELLGKDRIELPIVDMAKASTVVPLK